MNKDNFIKVAKNVIDLEIKALKKLKNCINNSFNLAVEAIAKCQSKVILCGVGKSGLIAAKIAATLSSVGTPSFSLSADEPEFMWTPMTCFAKMVSRSGLWSSLMMKIVSKRDRMVGIKSMFSSALVSSHRPEI